MRTTDAHSGDGGWSLPGYKEERELGRGLSGRVVAAVETGTGRRVAILYLSPALAGDYAFMAGFRGEAEQLPRVDVPSVARVCDFVEQPGAGAALVTELISGISLAALLERRGPLPPEAALTALKGMLLGLAAVHRLGFGHGDLRPGNVLVDESGQVKLTNFGIARPAADGFPATGTPRYLAPEVWQGEPATSATDVYAATAVFYECLAGRPAFDGDLSQLREQHATGLVSLDGIDEPLRQLIDEGMAPNRSHRPHGAIAFVSALEASAPAAYGAGWEERGRGQLAAAVPPLADRGRGGAPAGGSPAAASGSGRPARGWLLAGAAGVLVAAGIAAAVAVSGSHHEARLSGSPPPRAAAGPATSLGAPALPATASASPVHPVSPAHNVSPASRPQAAGASPSAQAGAGYSGTVAAAAPLAVSGGLGTAILGEPYSASLSASGGNGGVRWGRVSGLPHGMTATPRGGTLVIAGTPGVTGDFPVTVTVSDTESPAQTGTGRLLLVIDAPAPRATPTATPTAAKSVTAG